MKKLITLFLAICAMLSLTACGFFGTTYETSPDEYGKWESYLHVPSFLPNSIEAYTVNSYSYTLYSYMDICYEVLLDITVDTNEFDLLLEDARSYSDKYEEQPAEYCEGYTEIVFMDDYEHSNDSENVGWADIEKVVYNPDTNNIVYVVFHANDTGVYNIEDVAYFKRFSISEKSYSNLKNSA